jgi:cyclopropane fatty-acyl-phospholipid synthase-like methyltransferase
MNNFWNTTKVRWYKEGLKYNSLPEKALEIILPETEDCETFLDVGSGCGTLSIPLAESGKKVTAMDSSKAMIQALQDEIKERGIKNIDTIEAAWGDVEIKPYDVILCANVPSLLKDSTSFLLASNNLAKKVVFLVVGADPNADKFYYKELYPLLLNKAFLPKKGFIDTYSSLNNMGIFANVKIIEYNFDQPFKDIDEALAFWKEYIPLTTDEHDKTLKTFLEKKLERKKEGLIARFRKKSAIIWWRK